MKVDHKVPYTFARGKHYPPVEDALDALVKKDAGDPSAWNDYVKKCLDVKKRFPKPKDGKI